MMDHSIELVIFDIGGVLVDQGGVSAMKELSGIDDDAELWSRWLSCRWVSSFESGRCSPADFATGVVDDWTLDISPNDFLSAFISWSGSPYPGAQELLSEVQGQVPTASLSNMNALQWEGHFSRIPMLHSFDYRFLSFELGCVKPDPMIFAEVAARLPVPAHRAFFLDDNAINIEAAAAHGFMAERAQGVTQARQALVTAGVLEGSPG
jgi:HAD superfamily hydrolase (TIGR01509 family)